MVKVKKKERVWEVPKQKQARKRGKKKKQQYISSLSSLQIDQNIEENHSDANSLTGNKISQIINVQQNYQHPKEKEQEHVAQQYKREQYFRKNAQLCLIRDILYSEIQSSPSETLLFQRPDEQQILTTFLRGQCSQDGLPDLLYAYGSPGIGKTYLIKNTLRSQQLQQKTLWLNCFSIISKNKLRRCQKQADTTEKNVRIVVLDEFDQLQSWLNSSSFAIRFKIYLKDLQNKYVQQYSQLKYILISNKSYKSFGNSTAQLSSILNFKRVLEIPFLPYPLKSISSIIVKKIAKIEQIEPSLRFNHKLIEIMINKIYSSSQDIRKVMEFLMQNYQMLLSRGTQQEADFQNKINFIDEITKAKARKETDENMDCHYLKMLDNKQKNLLKAIIIGYESAQKQNRKYLIQEAQKQARRLAINRNNTNLWLKEWSEMGIIALQQLHPKNQHYLQRLFEVKILVPIREWKQHFY